MATGLGAGRGVGDGDSIRVTSSDGPIADSFDRGWKQKTRSPSRQTTGESASTTSTSANPSRTALARNSRLALTRTGAPV